MQQTEPRRQRPPEKREPPIVSGRVPPHDLDAESAVLSAALLHAPAIDEVLPILSRGSATFGAEKYYSDSNGLIWEAICMLRSAQPPVPVDIVSVASWLRDRGRLAQIGGATYLAQIADATPAVAHVKHHAAIVYRKWRMRMLIVACQTTTAYAYGDVGEDEQVFIDQHLTSVAEIAKGAPRRTEPVQLSQLIGDQITKMQQPGGTFGVPTGFRRLDRKMAGLHRGELIIVAARPGMGKTSLALDLAVNIAAPISVQEDPEFIYPQHAAIVFSLEMPRDQVVVRHLCSVGRVDVNRVRQGVLDEREWRNIVEAGSWLETLNLWVDDTPAITVPEVASKVRALKATFEREADPANKVRGQRIGAVVIDYLQIMKGRGGERSTEEELSHISQDLKAASKELDVPIIALAQLNRDVEKRPVKDRRPVIADLRGSGQLEQDADAILMLYRPEYYAPGDDDFKEVCEIIVAKQRNGSTGRVVVRYQKSYTRFSEWDPEDYARLKDVYAKKGGI